MTKKEQAEFDNLKQQVRLAKALSWTQPVAPDVAPPAPYDMPATKGYHFNARGGRVEPACSQSQSHYFGAHKMPSPGMGSRSGIWLYSTRLRALQAMRHEIEQEVAARLARIDEQIEQELAIQ